MTTPQQSASCLRPSRICRFLLCLVMFKLCLIGSMFVEPLGLKDYVMSFLPFSSSSETGEAGGAGPLSGPLAANSTDASADKAGARPIIATPTAHAATENPENAQAAAAPQSNLSREATQRRQAELARKEQDLLALEKDLDDRLMRLQELEMRIQAMLKEAEEVKSAKYRHLVDVLGNMKAKQAASVLETLDEKIAVKVLSGMRGRQAGEILTFVNPGKAARLSESLARVQMPFE